MAADRSSGGYTFVIGKVDKVLVSGSLTPEAVATPEPATLAPAGLAVMAGVGLAWRKRQAA
jgi:hypothetical protein